MHQDWRDGLSAWLDGEPTPRPVADLERHLDECPDCAEWFAGARALRTASRPAPQPDRSRWLIATLEAHICACRDGGECLCTDCHCETCTCQREDS